MTAVFIVRRVLEEESRFDTGGELVDLALNCLRDLLINIDNQVPDLSEGIQVLRLDISTHLRDDSVNRAQHAWDIPVNVENSVTISNERQFNLRKVHRAGGASHLDKLEQGCSDL
jgi:hypothetical protein